MTGDELRAKYNVAYKIIARERRMREHVFPEGHSKREEKLGEIDRLLEVVTELKDALKEHVGIGFEQPALLDVPQRTSYP